jgi:hypothetical protein
MRDEAHLPAEVIFTMIPYLPSQQILLNFDKHASVISLSVGVLLNWKSILDSTDQQEAKRACGSSVYSIIDNSLESLIAWPFRI